MRNIFPENMIRYRDVHFGMSLFFYLIGIFGREFVTITIGLSCSGKGRIFIILQICFDKTMKVYYNEKIN